MKIKDIVKIGNFITFTYGDAPYLNHDVGKIIKLNIPTKSMNTTMKGLSWRQKLDLEGYISILTNNGKEMYLCMTQVVNGCKPSTKNEVKRWKSSLQKNIKSMRDNADYLERIIKP